MGDSYRPGNGHGHPDDSGRYQRGPPRAPHNFPPRPRSPGYDNHRYDRRDDDHDHYRPERSRDHDYRNIPSGPSDMRRFGQPQQFSRNDFSFNPNVPPPPDYPARPRENFDDTAARRRARQGEGRNWNRRGKDGRGNRQGGFRKLGASERELLQLDTRERTPPQLSGMNEGKAGIKYVDLISSDEEEGNDHENAQKTATNEPPKPKWSNPETYTALPPPDESQRKRKDVVKLIRKSRMDPTQETPEAPVNAIASNDDFISLGFDNEEEETLVKPDVPGRQTRTAADRPVKAATGTVRSSRNQPAGPHSQPGSIRPANNDAYNTVEARLRGSKRKREADDEDDLELRQLRPPSKSLKPGPMSRGFITSEWQYRGSNNRDACPWFRPPGPVRKMAKALLHQEILDFYALISPKHYENVVRQDLLKRLQRFMEDFFPGTEVHVFGSFAAGLHLPDADMDVVAISHEYRTRGYKVLCNSANQMHKLASELQRAGLADANIQVISKSKVPIIKFVDRLTSIKVDISFENSTGIAANETFRRWKSEFPAMPIIVMVIKQFLLMRGLNDVASGGIGGFTITCLVTSLLQNMPRVQTGELDPLTNLGEILIEFLHLYGSDFNHERTAIRMDPPGYANKGDLLSNGQIRKANPARLMIIDPNRPDNDISGGSKNIQTIFAKFAEARNALRGSMNMAQSPDQAGPPVLLSFMLGGCYDSFLWYRRHLRRVHEDFFGPVTNGG